jgi:hypothetical protein
MKQFYTNITVFVLLLSFSTAYSQLAEWAVSSMGHGDNEYGAGICTDNNGNIISVGYFEEVASFGATTFAAYGSVDIVVQKFDPDGNYLWQKHFGGFGEDYTHSVVTDSQGNIYFSGRVLGQAYFEGIPITGGFSNSKYYLVKLDPDGNVLWAHNYAGSPTEYSKLAIDSNDIIHLMGSFAGTRTFGSFTLTNTNGNLFVLKINAAGTVINALQMASRGSTSKGSMFIDSNDNLYVTGSFFGIAPFGTFTLNSGEIFFNLFVTKISPNGTFLWAKQMTNSSFGESVIADSLGNIYISGSYSGTCEFDGQTITAESGNYSHFIIKMNSDGARQWINSFNTADTYGFSHSQLAIGNQGQLYHMFTFYNDMNFNGNLYTASNLSTVINQALLSRFNTDGTFVWSSQLSDFEYKACKPLYTINENIYVTGGATTNFFEGLPLNNDSAPEILVARIKDNTPPEDDVADIASPNIPVIRVLENPISSILNIDLGKHYKKIEVQLYAITGQLIENYTLSDSNNIRIPIEASRGLYFINVQLDGINHSFKVFKI